MIKRIFCILLSVTMIITLTPSLGTATYEAEAASAVSKIEITGAYETAESEEAVLPEAGKSLPKAFRLKAGEMEWTVSDPQWTYESSAGTVLDCGEAYVDTVYAATLRIPQDKEKGMVFSDEMAKGDISVMEGAEVTDVFHYAVDGSLYVQLTFNSTASEGGKNPPDDFKKLTVRAFDGNDNDYIKNINLTYYVAEESTATVMAPTALKQKFVEWKAGSDFGAAEGKDPAVTFTVNEGKDDYYLTATYYPLVESISAVLEGYPQAGKAMPSASEFYITVKNKYGIDPADVDLEWNPQPKEGVADYDTAYTLTATIHPKDQRGIHIISYNGKKLPASIAQYVEGKFFLSETANADVNGGKAEILEEEYAITYVFGKTAKRVISSIGTVEDISGLPYQSSVKDILAALPKTAKGYFEDGAAAELTIDWGSPELRTERKSVTDPSEYVVKGSVRIPEGCMAAEGMNPEISVNVSVKGAPSMEELGYGGSIKMLKIILDSQEGSLEAIETQLAKKNEIGAKKKLMSILNELNDMALSNAMVIRAGQQEDRIAALKARIQKDLQTADRLSVVRAKHTPPSKKLKSISRGKGYLKVKWIRASKANQKKYTGYQIRYSLKKDFSSGVKYKKVKKSAKSVKIRNLKHQKKYYVQLRRYKVYNGKTYYSKWSRTKSRTVK